MRAALYARVSSRAQAEEDKVSIGEQFAEMEAYCERQGYETVGRYQDVGSGSTKRRPDFQRMLDDARGGLFEVILCWKSDRLSRGIYPAAALMEVVEAYQLHLESVTDSLDMKTFGIYAAVGKIEIDNFKERATLGKRGAAKRGKVPVGSIPYGYRIGADGRPNIEPEEGPIVQRIFHEYVHEDKGARIIARELTQEGVSLRKGSKWGDWSTTYILRLLQHEAYKGTNWYGRWRHIVTEAGSKRFPQPPETWIRIPFPALVDEDTWERVQALKTERRKMAKRNTREIYLVQGLLVCEECSLGFRARTQRKTTARRKGKLYTYEYPEPKRYYICLGSQNHGLRCRQRSHLRATTVDELVWTEVAKVLKEPDTILRGLQTHATEEGTEAIAAETTKAEREIQGLIAEEDRAIRLYVIGKITEAQLDRQKKFITERIEQARARLDSLKAELRAVQHRQSLAEGILAWTKEVEAGLDALSPEERQKVLRLVLDRVSINREGRVRITLAIPAPEFVSDVSQRSCWWW